jgi:pyruvate kinase
MDVARLNLSHGSHAEHASLVRAVRRASSRAGRPVGVLLDLAGPKIRTGVLPPGGRALRRGEEVVLAPAGPGGRASGSAIPVTYARLARDVGPGRTLLLDDGLLRLTVLAAEGRALRCRVEEGGRLGDHKGINAPGAALSVPSLTSKDRRDLAFGVGLGVDFVALSFVRSAADVRALRRLLRGPEAARPAVVAKLEKPQALDDLDAILEASDAVMVARGDLGVEIPPERVPIVQKEVIERANRARRPVITATQMLESMVEHPRPTRAEASDVANAVLDGTDAVMLSAETASGRFPVDAVRMMARIIESAERAPRPLQRGRSQAGPAVAREDALCEAAARLAEETGARLIVAFTRSGFTARLLSKHRPATPVVAFTPAEEVRRRLTLVWGVHPHRLAPSGRLVPLLHRAEARLLEAGLARRGDIVVLVMGHPIARMGTTNLLKIHRVGEAVTRR